MINDGQIEYDLSTLRVKVDYTYKNFYDKDNATIAARLIGSMPGYTEVSGGAHTQRVLNNSILTGGTAKEKQQSVFKATVDGLRKQDTNVKYHYNIPVNADSVWEGGMASTMGNVGTRVVAKITVRVKVYIPYKQLIMQLSRRLERPVGENHLSVTSLQEGTGHNWDVGSDGVWYEYSTYRAISR